VWVVLSSSVYVLRGVPNMYEHLRSYTGHV